MPREFVTELVGDELAVLVIGAETSLRREVLNSLQSYATPEIKIHPVTASEVLRHAPNQLASLYKIVWVCEYTPLSEEQNQLLATLKNNASNVLVIFPLLTPIQTPPGSVFSAWQRSAQKQQDSILAINYQLPQATFIFGLDVVGTSSVTHPLYFLSEWLPGGQLFDPHIQLRLQSESVFAAQASQFVFRPQPQPSVLIAGAEIDSSLVIHELLTKYQAYHQLSVTLTDASVRVTAPVPFSVTTSTTQSSDELLVSTWVQRLPSPQQVAVPAEKKNTLPFPSSKQADAVAALQPSLSPPPKQVLEQIQGPKLVAETLKPRKSGVSEVETILNTSNALQKKPASTRVDVNNELQRIFQSTRREQKVSRTENMATTEKKVVKKSKRKTALFFGGLVFIGISLGVLFLIMVFWLSQWWVKSSLVAVASAITSTPEEVETSMARLDQATNVLSVQTESYGAVFDLEVVSQSETLVQVSQEIQETWQVTQNIRQLSQQLVMNVLGNGTAETQELSAQLFSEVERAYEHLSLVQAGLDQLAVQEESAETATLFTDYQKQLQAQRKALAVLQQLKTLLPTLTGQTERKTYALVLQNSQELRPTGGFIQAVALVSFERGALINTQILSSYELDKQLPGTVVAPDEVKRFLSEQNWFLRDSNWDPHFPDTAAWNAWFIEKSLGTSIDGVIAINLYTLEDIIEVLGPVDLPEYNEVLTHRNLQERMEFHSEEILVSTGKSDYSVVLLEKIIKRLTTMPAEKVSPLLNALYLGFADAQNLMVVLGDEGQTLSNLGWTGALVSPECPAQLSQAECQVSTMAQVEANIGVNKANYYLKRSVDHLIELQPQKAVHTRTIKYENNASSAAWPKGPYQSYVRFYVEPTARYEKVLIDGVEVPLADLVQRQEHGKLILGVPLTVGIKSQKTLEVVYSTPLLSQSPFSYAFFNQHQSGTSEDPLVVTMKLDPTLTPTLVAPQAEVNGNEVVFASTDNGHDFFGLSVE